MNSSDLLTAFRQEMNDRMEPFLWSDEEVFGFMDDAQTMFCRKTDGIADYRTAAVTQLSVVPGTDWYATHLKVLQIRSAARGDDGRGLELLTAEIADRRLLRYSASIVGPVKLLVTGLEPNAVRFAPVPNETLTVQLSVYRLPLVTITDVGDQEFEIDAQHHIHLLAWMKHRAYDKQDAEVADRRKSDEFEQKFLGYCANVKREQERARRTPNSTIAYGGI